MVIKSHEQCELIFPFKLWRVIKRNFYYSSQLFYNPEFIQSISIQFNIAFLPLRFLLAKAILTRMYNISTKLIQFPHFLFVFFRSPLFFSNNVVTFILQPKKKREARSTTHYLIAFSRNLVKAEPIKIALGESVSS